MAAWANRSPIMEASDPKEYRRYLVILNLFKSISRRQLPVRSQVARLSSKKGIDGKEKQSDQRY